MLLFFGNILHLSWVCLSSCPSAPDILPSSNSTCLSGVWSRSLPGGSSWVQPPHRCPCWNCPRHHPEHSHVSFPLTPVEHHPVRRLNRGTEPSLPRGIRTRTASLPGQSHQKPACCSLPESWTGSHDFLEILRPVSPALAVPDFPNGATKHALSAMLWSHLSELLTPTCPHHGLAASAACAPPMLRCQHSFGSASPQSSPTPGL